MSDLPTIIQNLQELERLQQLNYELLEELDIVLLFIKDNNIQVPNEQKFKSLLSKTASLMRELYFSSTKTVPYGKLNRRKVTGSETDDNVPVPIFSLYKGGYSFSEH